MKKHSAPTISWLNALGGLLLAFCFISLVIGIIIFLGRRPDPPKVSEIHLSMETDSTGVLTPTAHEALDSLIFLVTSQDNELRLKYDYILNQKSEENGLLTFGGLIISVIIAILGFFGYRSFQSIEQKAVINAEGKAKEKLDKEMGVEVKRIEKKIMTEIQNRFDKEYNTTLKDEVAKQLYEEYNDSISSRLRTIESFTSEQESIKSSIEWFKTIVSALESQGIISPSGAPQSEALKSLAENRSKVKEMRKGGED